MKEKLAVLGRAGPVHEPCRFKGSGIEARKSQIICNAAGDRSILVRRNRACQRNDKPQAHLFRGMTVSRIKCIGVDERHVQIVHETGIGVVRVQAQHTAIDYAGVVALAVDVYKRQALGRHPRDPYQPQQLGRGHARALLL